MNFRLEATGSVRRLTLDRADRHNAFDDELIGALTACLDELAADQDVAVLVLASSGKSFSAGADLGWMRRMADYDLAENEQDARALAGLMHRLDTMPMPVIARVQGPVIGGGVGLVACCDVVIAVDTAFFQLSEVKLGLTPATISPYVIRAIGPRAARRYFLTAERITAAQALNLGLIHEVCTAEHLDQHVDGIVDTILANAPQAVRAAKKLVLDYAFQPPETVMNDSAQRIARIRTGNEAQTRIQQFLGRQKETSS